MHLYKTTKGIIIKHNDESFLLQHNWNDLINRDNLFNYLKEIINDAETLNGDACDDLINNYVLPPIHTQEVWAAGVTYLKSRDARMEESKDTGGADCYQKVYEAERPELFFKAMPYRVAGT